MSLIPPTIQVMDGSKTTQSSIARQDVTAAQTPIN